MEFLANNLPDVSPAMFGTVVIVLLQIGQFYLSLSRKQRSEEAAKKDDLIALKKEFMGFVNGLKSELKSEIGKLDRELDEHKEAGDASSAAMYEKINGVATDVAGLKTSAEFVNQQLSAQSTKLDQLIARPRR